MGNTHPRFGSWFMVNGTPFAAVGDFLAAVLTAEMEGGNHAPNHVEAQVVNWCKEIAGFPEESSGLLVSGGSMANFVVFASGVIPAAVSTCGPRASRPFARAHYLCVGRGAQRRG